MNPERAPCGVKADFEPTDDAKDNEFPKVRERNPERGYHRACGSVPHCQQQRLWREQPSSQKELSICVHRPLFLLKYLRKKYYCKCCRAVFKMGRLSGWNSCPGPVSHPRPSLRVGKMKLPLPDGRLSQSHSSFGCRAAASRTNTVEGVRGRGSVLLLAFFREEQKTGLLPNESNAILLHMFL